MSEYLEIARKVMSQPRQEPERLEAALKGYAIELWSQGDRFWLVADEEDAAQHRQPRGSVYTAAEARRVVLIADPRVVAEVHHWKLLFNATVREITRAAKAPE